MQSSGKYSIYKLTKVLLAILFIPALIISLSCAVIIFQTKSSDGIPKFFNNYAFEMYNNNFNATKNIKSGDKLMFTKLGEKAYKKGDIIIYDATESEKVYAIYEEALKDSFSDNDELSIIQTNNNHVSSEAFDNATTNGIELENGTTVKIGIVGGCAMLTVADGKVPVYAVYNNGEFSGNYETIAAERIIGKNVETSEFLSTYMLLSTSQNGFVLLIILPLIIVLGLAFISFITGKEYAKDAKKANKQVILDKENAQEKAIGSGDAKTSVAPQNRPVPLNRPGAPQRPVPPNRTSAPQRPGASQRPVPPNRPSAPQKPVPPNKPSAPQRPVSPNIPRAPQRPNAPARPIPVSNPSSPVKPAPRVVPNTKPAAPQKPTTPIKPNMPSRPAPARPSAPQRPTPPPRR